MIRPRTIIAVLLSVAVIAALIALFFWPHNVVREPVTQDETAAAYALLRDTLEDGRYTYADFITDNAGAYTKGSHSVPVSGETVTLEEHGTFETEVTVPEAGFYSISADTLVEGRAFDGATFDVLINGASQYYEASVVNIPIFWRDVSKDFPLDRYNDETKPEQEIIREARRVHFYDRKYSSSSPLMFLLNEGVNTITVGNKSSQRVNLSDMLVYSAAPPPTYDAYKAANSGQVITGPVLINAISYTSKNSPYVQLGIEESAAMTPYDAIDKKINIVTIEKAGCEAFYTVEVNESGLYAVSLHALPMGSDFAGFATLRVDGEVPFTEAAAFSLIPEGVGTWSNYTLAGENGEPYYVYLSSGVHELSLRAEVSPIYDETRAMQLLTDHINQFSLQVTGVTGKEVDTLRTWRITRYIPETVAYLDAYDVILRDLLERLAVYGTKSGSTSALTNLDQALALLDILREDPDELPLHLNYLASFGGADTSIVKLCAAASDSLQGRGFNVDMIYLHGDTELPAENASLGDSLNAGASQVWSSYTNPKYIVRNREDALNIWVNQSVLMTDAIQKLIDTRFTPQTGIEVNLSVMPDVQKLVLSEAAGTNPDMALGLEAHIPFDLASRGALYDMNQFEDYWNVADGMVPGSFISYVFNEGIYAMPESVNFYAMVYRTDILNSLGLTPPDTWDEVAAMMATLQRFNMSFYMPVATGEGYKWFYQTAPLIYQNGGSLYAPDGLSATIGEPEAVKAITDFGELFTTYALEYQVPSFFNSFRFGQTPIGIVDSGTYLLLRTNAPELAGQWELAPHPGTAQADGSVSRWYIGNGRGAVIFKDAKFDKEVCWDFLKWWVSDEIQTEYAFNLAANSNILWLSANLNALESTPMIEDDHIGVVMDSVMWLRDVPRSPGQYLLERSLSDIWNAMVTQDTPARAAIDERLVEIQREFRRKMREFGYIDDANTPLKPYTVREMDWVLAKLKEAGQ